MPQYQSGVCNIGKNVIRKRYGLAAGGFAIALVVSYAILYFDWTRLALLVSFVLFFMGFEGFYQGYFKFCAGFASRGIYDFSGSGGSRNKVTDLQYHKEDMKKAMQINLYSIVSSAVVVVIINFAF